MSVSPVRVIGADWATEDRKRGVAVVDFDGDAVSLVHVSTCNARRKALHLIAESVAARTPALIAIDAPLGWPEGLSCALVLHAAGEQLQVRADAMFSRETDHFVKEKLRCRPPLEVGANLIARTAHSANAFLAELRADTGYPIPLLWSPGDLRDVGAIEVYPAATRRTVAFASASAALGLAVSPANEHVKDALWCVLAGAHFLRGECHQPLNEASSRREGWIWFRQSE